MKKHIVNIDKEKCKECGLCIAECKQGILRISSGLNDAGYHPAEVTEQSKCTGCTFCAIMCPECIIEVLRVEE